MSSFRFSRTPMLKVMMVAAIVPVMVVSLTRAAELDGPFHEQRDQLLRNAEEMVAHGGMGDAQAIVHHCGEAARFAESLIKQVSTSHPEREETVVPLNEVIRQCKRVSEIGGQADPGVLLNPAIKARAAARTAIRSLRGAQ